MKTRRLILLGACALVVGGAIAVWQMTRIAPAWYAPPPVADPAIIELADRVEYRLVQEAQQIRPDENPPWTLRIREEQINAWLAARLRKWIEREQDGEWPEHLGVPQVQLSKQGISIAVPIQSDSSQRIIVARIHPAILSGRLTLELDQVAIGRLTIPGAPLSYLSQAILDPGTTDADHAEQSDWPTQVLRLLDGSESIEPILTLSDGRRVQLLDVHCDEGVIDLTARTLPEHPD